MSEPSAHRRLLVYLLGIAALGIWGVVAFRFSGYISDVPPPESATSGNSPKYHAATVPVQHPRFEGDYRDPFLPVDPYLEQVIAQDDSENHEEIEKKADLSIWRLRGIIGQTALLQAEGSSTIHYLDKNGMLDRIQLISVWKDSVVIRSGSNLATLNLARK